MNRKQFLLTLSVAVISGILGGALSVWFLMPPSVLAQGGPEGRTIEAERFVLKDSEGKTRAELRMRSSDKKPVFELYDAGGETRTQVGENTMTFYKGTSRLFLSSFGLTLTVKGVAETSLTANSFRISEPDDSISGKLRVIIKVVDNNPMITIMDEEGFLAVLGSTPTVETRTGRTNQTSAASLMLFGKDGKVIWSAP